MSRGGGGGNVPRSSIDPVLFTTQNRKRSTFVGQFFSVVLIYFKSYDCLMKVSRPRKLYESPKIKFRHAGLQFITPEERTTDLQHYSEVISGIVCPEFIN